MEIESIRISLRERNPWQAIDLGFNITRQFSATLYKSYLVGILLFTIPTVLLLRNYPTWAGLFIWYIKPLFEVGPQVLLSRIIFGENFSNREIINITLNSIKNYWWPSLTSLRFTIRRSFVMPVFLLEGLKSNLRRKRLRTLSLGQSQGPTSLTVLSSHAEMLFYFVILFIIYQFIPEYERVDPLVIFKPDSEQLGFQWLSIYSWIVSTILIAPFYISSGFALYLNKRIELEGWDLELSFKKIKKRLASLSSQLGCMVFLFLSVAFISDVNAQQSLPDPIKQEPVVVAPIERDDSLTTIEDLLRKEQPEKIKDTQQKDKQTAIENKLVIEQKINQETQEDIQKILENEPLVELPEKSYWRWKKDQDSENNSSVNLSGFSSIMEVLLWAGLVALIVWLVLQLPQLNQSAIKSRRSKKIKRQAQVFGVVLDQEEIDQDLSHLISIALEENDFRKVLALLLASALGELTLHSSKRIPRGATESDCLLIAEQVQMNKVWLTWFESLLMKWSYLAWGHKELNKEQLVQLVNEAPIDELQLSRNANG